MQSWVVTLMANLKFIRTCFEDSQISLPLKISHYNMVIGASVSKPHIDEMHTCVCACRYACTYVSNSVMHTV